MKKIIPVFIFSLGAGLLFSQGLPLPYNTGFDTPAEKEGWEQYRTGFLSAYSWTFGGGGASAPSCLSHDYNVGGNPADTVVDWFVSPPLHFTAPGEMTLKVRTSGFSTPFPDNFEVWFGTGDPDPEVGDYTLIANLSYMLPQFEWLDTLVNIPFVSDSGYIAFKYKTIGAAWSTYAVDDISVSVITGLGGEGGGRPESLSLKAFPNPFSSTVRIELPPLNGVADLEVYDLQGRLLRVVNGLSAKEEFILDGTGLEAGLYFLRLRQDGKTIATGKVMAAED